jgi:hypothetical protein
MSKNPTNSKQCWQCWQFWQWIMLLPLVLVMSVPAAAQTPLRVVSAAPNGEIATLAEANEIRVVFSEPMAAFRHGYSHRSSA